MLVVTEGVSLRRLALVLKVSINGFDSLIITIFHLKLSVILREMENGLAVILVFNVFLDGTLSKIGRDECKQGTRFDVFPFVVLCSPL